MGQNSTERGDLQGQQGVVKTGRPETTIPQAPPIDNPADSHLDGGEIKGGEAAKPAQREGDEDQSAKD